ncbi:hypothetical protein ALC57_03955 [Trachymyrmex cornetzi]|uniref:GIY-YIG domain-containing protein n=1 Tax=Trachymyrmex cornetzi TaxID=471704 RepID=A0A151JLN0_9HYME|nr:hypothetical protein ALC57_03955 [Trachymyrmex cornetzi]
MNLLSKCNFNIPIYYRYVDDIILAAPNNQIREILDLFNSYHDRLKFTCEENNDKSMNFLDVSLIIEKEHIIFNNYKKPTNSGRYLNYNSNHPINHKRGVIIGQFDRIIFLSHPKFHTKNIENMIDILLNNGYPLEFLFSTINKRIKNLSRRDSLYINNVSLQDSNENNGINNYFIIPYIKEISEKFKSIAKKNDFTVAFKPINTLNSIIKTGKDKLKSMEHSCVVYRIDCLDCEACYVGQTKRKIETRIAEHKSSSKKSNNSHMVVAQHQAQLDHNFDWKNVKILDMEHSLHRRLTSEMIFIKKHSNVINKQTDTEKFPEIYLPLLNSSTNV